jgi:ATP-dependent Zn protease
MGGIAAESIRYGRASTTAEDDIARATALAKEMIGLYGMSPEVGRVRLLNRYGGFLGGASTTVDAGVSEETLHLFDGEVKSLIARAESWATSVLTTHGRELVAMAERLREEETLEGSALEEMMKRVSENSGNQMMPPKRVPVRKAANSKVAATRLAD